jgi:hypothetical protein
MLVDRDIPNLAKRLAYIDHSAAERSTELASKSATKSSCSCSNESGNSGKKRARRYPPSTKLYRDTVWSSAGDLYRFHGCKGPQTFRSGTTVQAFNRELEGAGPSAPLVPIVATLSRMVASIESASGLPAPFEHEDDDEHEDDF